jgi:hypothetical protein
LSHSRKNQRTPAKNEKNEKKFGRGNLIENWVERKNRGLKISGILARWTY